MRVVKIIIGIVLVLAALFAGGCGVVFGIVGLAAKLKDLSGDRVMLVAFFGGIVPGIACGFLARWAFRSARRTP